MIDVARDVLAHRAVDGPAVIELEQIFVLDRVVFLLSAIQQRTKIADDFGALLDRFGGEETKPGAGTADAIGFIRRNGRHDRSGTDRLKKATGRGALFYDDSVPMSGVSRNQLEPSPDCARPKTTNSATKGVRMQRVPPPRTWFDANIAANMLGEAAAAPGPWVGSAGT